MIDPKLATLTGYEVITAEYWDGTREDVRVRALAIGEMPDLLAAITDEAATIALLTGRDLAWANTLTHESAEEILEAGRRLNADFFWRWRARREALQAKLFPEAAEAIRQAVAAVISQTPSPSSASPLASTGTPQNIIPLPKPAPSSPPPTAPGPPRP